MRQCKTCGATFTQGETRCPYCGARLIPGEDKEPKGAAGSRFGRDAQRREASGGPEGFDSAQKRGWSFSAFGDALRGGNPPPLNIFRRSRQDMVVAAILAIFLGTFGAHWFFLGKSGRGVLCLIFCWTGIPTIVGILEGVGFLLGLLRDGGSQ